MVVGVRESGGALNDVVKERENTYVVDESILGGVSLGLESAEEGLLGTEDLNGRGGVLGQVGEGSSVGDEASSNGVANEGGEVGSDDAHLLREVRLERLAVLEQVDHARGKVTDVEVVDGGDVGAHGRARSVDNVASEDVVVLEELGEALDRSVGEGRLVADEGAHLGVLVVVGNDADELGEVPSIPLAHAHGKSVDVLVELVEQGDRLDDHVVGAVDVELYLGARVGVTKAELGAAHVAHLEAGEELLGVETDATDDLERALGGIAVDVEGRLDGLGESTLFDSEDDAGLLAEVELEETLEELVNDTCERANRSALAPNRSL